MKNEVATEQSFFFSQKPKKSVLALFGPEDFLSSGRKSASEKEKVF